MPSPQRKSPARPGIRPETIKAAARRLMAERGTAGLTLRGIARELDVTAPAIYNYFPRLEDLITGLIVDAFTDLAQAMQAADSLAISAGPGDRAFVQCLAYRRWATEHPLDFQLIYGNPIPGYTAPADITIPLARRPFLGLFACFLEAYQAGDLKIPSAYPDVPTEMRQAIAGWKQLSGIEMPYALLALLLSGWARIHGMVMLELFHHIQPLVGDGEHFYRYELEGFLRQLGLRAASGTGVAGSM
jgi:AcrR family transcriptional regulator